MYIYTYTSICDNAEYTNFQDCDREPSYNYRTTFLPRLIWMSRFAYTHSFFCIAEPLETLRCHRHRVVSNRTTCPSRDEEKSLSKSRTVHQSVRSLTLFLDTIHVVDHAARTEQWTSPWEIFRTVLTVQVSLRYATFL